MNAKQVMILLKNTYLCIFPMNFICIIKICKLAARFLTDQDVSNYQNDTSSFRIKPSSTFLLLDFKERICYTITLGILFLRNNVLA